MGDDSDSDGSASSPVSPKSAKRRALIRQKRQKRKENRKKQQPVFLTETIQNQNQNQKSGTALPSRSDFFSSSSAPSADYALNDSLDKPTARMSIELEDRGIESEFSAVLDRFRQPVDDRSGNDSGMEQGAGLGNASETHGDARHMQDGDNVDYGGGARANVDGSKMQGERGELGKRGASVGFYLDASELDLMSNRQRKLYLRDKIAELKATTLHPEVVDSWDVTAPDPDLLVQLKSIRSTVPVPLHWSAKRRYLSAKRGTEMSAYKLPDYIEATGIRKIREAMVAQDAKKSMIQKGRERLRPSVGRMNIDYSILLHAFEQQTRPSITGFGELYFEGKENVLQNSAMGHLKPGKVSAKLRRALGLENETQPVPWLWAMQKLGPPPGYASLKIPGVTSPPSVSVVWGYGQNGWGAPPAGYEWITKRRPVEEIRKDRLWGAFEQENLLLEQDAADSGGFQYVPFEPGKGAAGPTSALREDEYEPGQFGNDADEDVDMHDKLVPDRLVLHK
eukprot:ANDGO_08610.mRNA.1 Pre-mRNA-splicing factor sap145